jgi:hypothetical protein
MSKNSEVKKQKEREKDMEGQTLQIKSEAMKTKLSVLREEKLKELERSGIPDKFKADLATKKIF